MDFVPILWRELIVSSRRGAIGLRAGSAGLVLLVMMVVALTWYVAGWDRASISGISTFAQATLSAVVAAQGILTLMLVTDDSVRILVGERQRKTLDMLLASSLSSAGIILGVLAAALARLAAALAAGLPLILLMVPVLGVDPRLILLAYASLGATGFVIAGLALVVSLNARSLRSALGGTMTLAGLWLCLPLLVVLLLPRSWPAGSAWVLPLARVLLSSSPAGLVSNVVGLTGRARLLDSAARMIAYETAAGMLLVVWATARLRPACLALADSETRAFLSRHLRTPRLRPVCGNDPMLWKELHATGRRGIRDLVAVIVPVLIGFTLLTLYFAKAAFLELFARGYGVLPGDASRPSSFFDWAVVLGRGISPAPGQARAVFNLALRGVSMVFGLFSVLLVTESASASIADERERDTWAALVLTPVTGREIVFAKALGSVWKLRGVLALLVGLWFVGLLSGAVHPAGCLAALAILIVSMGFYAVMVTTIALVTPDRHHANERSLIVVILLTLSGLLPRSLPPGASSVLLGSASLPLLLWLSLLSYNDVAAAVRSGAFPQLTLLAIDTGEGAMKALVTCLVGLTGQAAAAILLFRPAARRFEVSRRPRRSRE